MTSESDFWACAVCRSINASRADRCYSCHTPRVVAGVKPIELSPTESPRPLAPTGTYRSSEGLAVTVTVATVIFILATIAALWVVWSITDLRANGESEAADQLLAGRLPILAASPALGVLARIAYAAWISRVVANLPALGAGFSRVGPTMAFFEPLIPGFNLVALPARVGEVTRKLDPSSRSLVLIGAGWLLAVVPFLGGVWVLRFERFVGTGAEFFRSAAVTFSVTFAAQAAALVIGLVVIWQVEGLCRARRPSTT